MLLMPLLDFSHRLFLVLREISARGGGYQSDLRDVLYIALDPMTLYDYYISLLFRPSDSRSNLKYSVY